MEACGGQRTERGSMPDEDEDEDEAGDEAGPAACTCCVGRYYTHNLHSLNERNRNHFCFIFFFSC